MQTDIRHTAVLALGFVLVMLVVACGGTPQATPVPTIDVQATVQMVLQEERATEATVEAKAQAMAWETNY